MLVNYKVLLVSAVVVNKAVNCTTRCLFKANQYDNENFRNDVQRLQSDDISAKPYQSFFKTVIEILPRYLCCLLSAVFF